MTAPLDHPFPLRDFGLAPGACPEADGVFERGPKKTRTKTERKWRRKTMKRLRALLHVSAAGAGDETRIARSALSTKANEADALRLCAWVGWRANEIARGVGLAQTVGAVLLACAVRARPVDCVPCIVWLADLGRDRTWALDRNPRALLSKRHPRALRAKRTLPLTPEQAVRRLTAFYMGLTFGGQQLPAAALLGLDADAMSADFLQTDVAAAALSALPDGSPVLDPRLHEVVRTWLRTVPLTRIDAAQTVCGAALAHLDRTALQQSTGRSRKAGGRGRRRM